MFPFQLDRAFDAAPRARRWIPRVECRHGTPNLPEVLDERAALGARREVPLHFGALAPRKRLVDVVVDDDFVRVHVYRSSARSFARALNTCDFDVPSAMPSSDATSL